MRKNGASESRSEEQALRRGRSEEDPSNSGMGAAGDERRDAGPDEILGRLAGFAQALRGHGLPVGTDDVAAFCSALAELSPGDPFDLYWSGRAALVHSRPHLAVYDEVFRSYFLGTAAPGPAPHMPDRPAATSAGGTLDVPDSEPGEQPAGDQSPLVLGLQASAIEIARHKRFESCTPGELAALRRIMARIRLEPPRRRTRRRCAGPAGPQLDIRRMTRDAMRLGPEPPQIRRLERKTRPRKLVLVLDVSGSMADCSRNLLQFAYSMRRAAQKVEVFCFGTRLTRITAALDRRNPDDAMRLAADRVLDWDGGTRIGESLDDFVRNWGRRGLSRGADVVICSDGLDRGDPALLADAAERLSRLCHRIVWMNPLAGEPPRSPGTRVAGRTAEGASLPDTVAMKAAGPFIDVVEPGRSLADLEGFAARLAALR